MIWHENDEEIFCMDVQTVYWLELENRTNSQMCQLRKGKIYRQQSHILTHLTDLVTEVAYYHILLLLWLSYLLTGGGGDGNVMWDAREKKKTCDNQDLLLV